MTKNFLFLIIFVAFAVIAGIFYFSGNRDGVWQDTGNILFYRDDCSHCKNVEEFIKANKVDEKIQFVRMEVLNNKKNAALLSEKARVCGISSNFVGVPFYWDSSTSTCLLGDVDIINYFREKII